ncbi:hypothetical protein AB3464_02110 [Pseudomonas asplenii]|uniref:hypothetical protein n=1 Tax=Pseudomonas asplenii TaxID=53407 RepID=UPI0037CBDEBF
MCDPNEKSAGPSLFPPAQPRASSATLATADVAASALLGLMGLRDALVAFKGPLADDPEFRRVIERLLFGHETRERMLGQPAHRPAQERPVDWLIGQPPGF